MNVKYQVVFLGSSCVGKTTLFNKMCNKLKSNVLPTIEYSSVNVTLSLNGKEVSIQLWDTAGQEMYRSMTSIYTRNANGIFLVFDLSNVDDSEDEMNYIKQQIENSPRDVSILIIGNKVDLFEGNQAPFNPKLQNIKNEIKHFDYIETSGLNGLNVQNALELMATHLEENGIKIINNPQLVSNDKPSNCC